ncbi:glycoside hydrolase family protein [Pontiella sulfatireligans]|uniref:CARDB domain-containing protein n=1 Tax=Pontiella sulfatireligans TaxID=2750658 RepID=A0A6C2UE18_9BACT|nr:glycoside hydrolase family protein [Pontiella sulfatireligans]VGO18103.1 hypothetical protein SCARR_00154 [Pontiella sulfatireligans]
MKQRLAYSLVCIFCVQLVGAAEQPQHKVQVVERERPAEWSKLVSGGRFMDLFQPMPDLGGMTSDTWGETNVVPRDVNNGIEDPKWSYWGGNTRLEADGKYHLLVARWPENAPKGHMSWKESVVVHAVCDSPYGPFKAKEEIGPGHNPTWYVTESGKYVLYIIDGAYFADSINGPWIKSELDYDSRDRKATKQKNYLANNSFIEREDGSFFLLNRHGQAWFSKDGVSTYHRVTGENVYPLAEGKYEDPVVWKDDVQYHLIVNDWMGRIAWYLRSKDGVNWKVEPGEAYVPGIAVHESGVKEDWFKFERVRMVQDKYGRAYAANLAVIDVLKHSDLPNDNHSSKLIVVPMITSRLLTVLNKYPLTSMPKTVRVKIHAEPGFNPHTDVEVDSLRFGASETVNFGGGSKVRKTEKDGADLIVFFDGEGHGVTEDNFAGKLLGKSTDGKLLFGWSRLPKVKYIEPILSSKLPVFGKDKIEVEVQNFGQVASVDGTVTVLLDDQEIASASVSPLKPFEKTVVTLKTSGNKIKPGKKSVTVRTEITGRKPELLTREMTIKK